MSQIMNNLKKLIKNKGPISVAEFFSEAMFHPLDGYYATKKPIGKNGDFITSPEISQVFGELIAAYFFNLILNSKNKIALVEMGAGNGTLFFDVITTIKKLAIKTNKTTEINSRLTFNIIEISDSLTRIQKEKLGSLKFKINWFRNFSAFKENNSNHEIYFFSNELFDCLETHQFQKTKNGWQEILVGLFDEQLKFILEDFNEAKHQLISKLAPASTKENDIFEYSFKANQLMNEISHALQKQGGVGLIIDYGYYDSPLNSTFQALKNHQFSNVLENVGDSDLTFHVDFKALEQIAKKNSLKTSFVTQREFLLSLGFAERQKVLGENIERLIDTKQMGELFKCLIIWK